MKLSNKAVSLMIIEAVLLAVGGVGLLIRQAWTGNSQTDRGTGIPGKDARPGPQAALPGMGQTADTAEDRARLKEERARMLEKMASLTEEEKEQFRNQIVASYSGQRPGRGASESLSAEQWEQMLQRWQNMSEEERAALTAKMKAGLENMRRQKERAAQPSRSEGTSTEQNPGKTDAEPNQANQS